jgi:hypothetical protein
VPEQSAISMRPGTILGYKGRSWRVISNDTLLQRFTVSSLDPPHETKSFNYRAGQVLQVRWVPTSRI